MSLLSKPFAFYIDQPARVNSLNNWGLYGLVPAASALKVAYDTATAAPEERGKTFTKSAAIAVGTIAAVVLGWRMFGHHGEFLKLRPLADELVENWPKVLEPDALFSKVKAFPKNAHSKAVQLFETHLSQKAGKTVKLGSDVREAFKKAATEKKGFDEAKLTDINVTLAKHVFDGMGKQLKGIEKVTLSNGKSALDVLKKYQAIVSKPNAAGKKTAFLTKPQMKELLEAVETLGKKYKGQGLDRLKYLFVPHPHDHTWKEILSELFRLSGLGVMTVGGGIAGGVAGNALVGDDWRANLKDQTKEGTFQLLANIMLCNVGAAGGLGLLQGLKNMGPGMRKAIEPRQKWLRPVIMLGGIVATGIAGGSWLANWLGNNLINPMVDNGMEKGWDAFQDKVDNQGWKSTTQGIFKERTPTFLDGILHLDDVAIVLVAVGFRWIEAILPFLYGISAQRSAVGYRNGHSEDTTQANSTGPIGPLSETTARQFTQTPQSLQGLTLTQAYRPTTPTRQTLGMGTYPTAYMPNTTNLRSNAMFHSIPYPTAYYPNTPTRRSSFNTPYTSSPQRYYA